MVIKCESLRDFVSFIQFEKYDKHIWRSVTFSKSNAVKVTTLLKVALPNSYFSQFLNL